MEFISTKLFEIFHTPAITVNHEHCRWEKKKKLSPSFFSRSFQSLVAFDMTLFFNYVLTSGSKSNMAQLFVQFSGFFDSFALSIRTNCPRATYVKHNNCSLRNGKLF